MSKKLYLSKNDKKLAGVCGGIAEYFEIDSTLVRLLWVLFSFAGGSGVLAYIIAAIIMSEEPEYPAFESKESQSGNIDQESAGPNIQTGEEEKDLKTDKKHKKKDKNQFVIGILLIAVGLSFASRRFLPFFWLDFKMIWPIALIIFGVFIILKNEK
jgi:phage shock protein C